MFHRETETVLGAICAHPQVERGFEEEGLASAGGAVSEAFRAMMSFLDFVVFGSDISRSKKHFVCVIKQEKDYRRELGSAQAQRSSSFEAKGQLQRISAPPPCVCPNKGSCALRPLLPIDVRWITT